jgi:hypothetical protein
MNQKMGYITSTNSFFLQLFIQFWFNLNFDVHLLISGMLTRKVGSS